jgi:hypothetical protein
MVTPTPVAGVPATVMEISPATSVPPEVMVTEPTPAPPEPELAVPEGGEETLFILATEVAGGLVLTPPRAAKTRRFGV